MSRPAAAYLADSLFRQIEATLAATETGRRFLAEHERRTRRTAIDRLAAAVARPPLPGDGLSGSDAEARAVVLDAVERLQETAWLMREAGLEPKLCEALDRDTQAILGALPFGAVGDAGLGGAPRPSFDAMPDPAWEALRLDALARLDALRRRAEPEGLPPPPVVA